MTDEELNEAIEYNLRHLEHDYSIEEELEEEKRINNENLKEIERLNNIIEKAVEYIERTQEGFISELKLLDILKGQ